MWGTEKGPQESEVTTALGATPTSWCSGQGFQPPGTPLCVCSLTGHRLAYSADPLPPAPPGWCLAGVLEADGRPPAQGAPITTPDGEALGEVEASY